MATNKPGTTKLIFQQPGHRPNALSSVQEESADDATALEDVDYSWNSIARAFRALLATKKCTVEDIDEHFRNKIPEQHLLDVDKRGGCAISFFHFLAQVPKTLEQRFPLFIWAMEKHPELYLRGVDENESILDRLSRKCKAHKTEEPFRLFVRHFPSQVSNILKRTRNQGELLSATLPFIRNLDAPGFLEFFYETSEASKSTADQCDCLDSSTVAEKNMFSQARLNILHERPGDINILSWSREDATSTEQQGLGSKQPIEGPGMYKDGDGRTPLHIASTYVECDEAEETAQFNLVKRMIAWCPAALECTDNFGRSPYLHRVYESGKANDGPVQDKITFLLKDNIMHLEDRDNVLALLYGRTVTTHPHNGLTHKASERGIHFDLRELQDLEPASEPQFLSFIETLNFEDILQYVRIPQHPFHISHSPGDDMKLKGSGRRDFVPIFDTLKRKGVKKIHKLVVDDDDTCLHQDDVIERLDEFEIEDFDWVKIDLSSTVLKKAVPHARTLRLSSSGNHSVLRDWSSTEGLAEMGMLESIFVKIYPKTESDGRIEGYARDFIARMVKNCPRIKSIVIRLEPHKFMVHEEWVDPTVLVTTNKWIHTIESFTGIMANFMPSEPSASNGIQVAVLDDGIDWHFAQEIGCINDRCRSFYADKSSSDFIGQNSWFSSSTGHGTIMAALIRKICPNATLYIARLDQTQSEQGVFQPTHDSAAKAIRWAIEKRVHIISMSWTIPGEHLGLENAVKEARAEGILLFGAASDQGANSPTKPYMAKLSDKGEGAHVICIGGAREAGYGDDRAKSEAEFFFPGQVKGLAGSLPSTRYDFRAAAGSSVATALAVGFTALIMLLEDTWPVEGNLPNAKSTDLRKYRQQLQNPRNIRKIFNNLLLDTSPDMPTDQRNAIIPVEKYFWLDKLRDAKNGVILQERNKNCTQILQDIVKRLLRPLTDTADGKPDRAADSSDEDEG
ncbi:uncharacterized protein GGS22DRAFT_158885 [Annulohypoxylon maeteangense]|uniref:uncharacterized protein n=1 Tax=Annulohypoxylon maeteangense TaxID=1927788 RepID=UPI002008C171|nr:uncharacterized protein GGS22DRAFT_158885 [Annulohypoxylon maeteangense]KAI0886865.1 hypothetical protein GGS22DRAFT_158885 [Annulohypoxylon maeteangense]